MNPMDMTVLYVEDDPIIKDNTATTLSYFFSKVVTASDGKEALCLLQTFKPDILITDYVMPYINGYDLICEAKKLYEDIIFFITSSYTDEEKLLQCIPLGLSGYLVKPINYEQLLSALKSIIEKKQAHLIDLETDIYYLPTRKIFLKKGREITLTYQEVSLVELFIKHRGELLSKNMMMLYLYGEIVDENLLKNLIYRLRKKVQEDLFMTVKNIGYVLK